MTDSTAPPAGLTAADLLAFASGDEPTRPLLTWYDDATGERVELSGRTFGNWVAKTANLLVDGCGLGRGDTASVDLPPHWQTAAVLVGCWTAGLAVTAAPADVAFAAGSRPSSTAPDRFVLGLAPMGMPMADGVPDGWVDFIAEMRGHGDAFTAADRAQPSDPAYLGDTHADLLARAAGRAAELGIAPNSRVLVDVAGHPDPLDWLLAPLTVRTSVVLCANLDPSMLAARLEAERASPV